MSVPEIHPCGCFLCQRDEDHPEKTFHRQMNVVMRGLNEQQRRWYAAVESQRYGWGGIRYVSQITGLDEKTIRRGRQELGEEMRNCPVGRVRGKGAGRPSVGKKSRKWWPR